MSYAISLRPDLPTEAVRPTLVNPDIQVVIGRDGNNFTPKGLIYPDYMTPTEVGSKVRKFAASKKPCKVCQRYAAEKTMANSLGIVILLITIFALIMIAKRS